MNTYRYIFSAAMFLIFMPGWAGAQIAISGLPCAVAGTGNGYLYTLSGDIDSADIISWRITGGVITNIDREDTGGTVSAIGTQVRITWNRGENNGRLYIQSNRLGSAELAVRIINIDNTISLATREVRRGSNITIDGRGPGSTACIPLYEYWWEKADSLDGAFIQLADAMQQITINDISQKAWYRRALSVNGTIVYSNILLVDPQ